MVITAPNHRFVGSKSSGDEIRIDRGAFNNCPSSRNYWIAQQVPP